MRCPREVLTSRLTKKNTWRRSASCKGGWGGIRFSAKFIGKTNRFTEKRSRIRSSPCSDYPQRRTVGDRGRGLAYVGRTDQGSHPGNDHGMPANIRHGVRAGIGAVNPTGVGQRSTRCADWWALVIPFENRFSRLARQLGSSQWRRPSFYIRFRKGPSNHLKIVLTCFMA